MVTTRTHQKTRTANQPPYLLGGQIVGILYPNAIGLRLNTSRTVDESPLRWPIDESTARPPGVSSSAK